MEEKCPKCSGSGEAVRLSLVRHQVKTPWSRDLETQEFSFCATAMCNVVYFSVEGLVLETADIRHPPAYKTGAPGDLLCYCFDVSGATALATPDPIPYVRERVRKGECACDILNPSGECCLGSIGRWRKDRGQR